MQDHTDLPSQTGVTIETKLEMRFFHHCFLVGLSIISLLACQPNDDLSTSVVTTDFSSVAVVGQREYEVHQSLVLVNEGPGQPEKQNIWVALIRDFPPYQEVLSMDVSPSYYELISDEYGNQYAEFDLSNHPAGMTKTIKIDYRIKVNELTYDLSDCKGEVPDDFTHAELHIESLNPQIVSLASELSRGKNTICEQARAFYDYIGEELVYTYNGKNWGAQAALGTMGADCTEYASLLVALSRSQGIPARYFEGLLFLNQDTKERARLEHAWTDIYMPRLGWATVDPTLGRALSDRDTYFAHHTPEHIIVTLGPNPSTLRGGSYWTHIYWPGDSTKIHVESGEWEIKLVEQ
jgi:transglutaminase-like putative cysteine protease